MTDLTEADRFLGKRSRSLKISACFWFQVCSSQRCRVSILSPPRAMGPAMNTLRNSAITRRKGTVAFRTLKWDYVQSHRFSDNVQFDTLVSWNDSSTSSVEHFNFIGEYFSVVLW